MNETIAKSVTIAASCVALLWAGMPAQESAPELGWTTAARVTRVIDGDTIEVEIKRTLRVRLLDCWAPESRVDQRVQEAEQQRQKARGLASKAHLARLAHGRDVIVRIPIAENGDLTASITLGRVLGQVWLADRPDESLSSVQVRTGHATARKPDR